MVFGKQEYTGFAVPLAWPEMYCKQAGSWYDKGANFLGISRNNYYKVGHAAILLVSEQEEKCYYFDFGRYHTPYKHGRVRSEFTDPDLTVHTKPEIKNGKILNFKEILTELQHNVSCHGEGPIYASYMQVNFKKAFEKARTLNKKPHIKYGPFTFDANNCSRFVKQVMLAGKPTLGMNLRIRLFKPIVPMPKTNVIALENKLVLPHLQEKQPFFPAEKKEEHLITNTLPIPEKHPELPQEAKWLGGEGSGSWFVLSQQEKHVHVQRYSPEGALEFQAAFQAEQSTLPPLHEVDLDYPSHHEKITLKHNNQEFILRNKNQS